MIGNSINNGEMGADIFRPIKMIDLQPVLAAWLVDDGGNVDVSLVSEVVLPQLPGGASMASISDLALSGAKPKYEFKLLGFSSGLVISEAEAGDSFVGAGCLERVELSFAFLVAADKSMMGNKEVDDKILYILPVTKTVLVSDFNDDNGDSNDGDTISYSFLPYGVRPEISFSLLDIFRYPGSLVCPERYRRRSCWSSDSTVTDLSFINNHFDNYYTLIEVGYYREPELNRAGHLILNPADVYLVLTNRHRYLELTSRRSEQTTEFLASSKAWSTHVTCSYFTLDYDDGVEVASYELQLKLIHEQNLFFPSYESYRFGNLTALRLVKDYSTGSLELLVGADSDEEDPVYITNYWLTFILKQPFSSFKYEYETGYSSWWSAPVLARRKNI